MKEEDTVVPLPTFRAKSDIKNLEATLKAQNFLGINSLEKFIVNHQTWIPTLNFRLAIKCLPQTHK